jgi:glycosyltransferase involved in cell wall biosynthesis
VVTIHGEWRISKKRRTILGRLRLYLMRHLADHFIAISEGHRQVMLEEGISPERISLIPNGLDVDFFRPPQPEERQVVRAQYGYGLDDVIVLFIGRLAFQKHVDLLLRAVVRFAPESRVSCIIAGDGPEMDNLQALAEDLRLRTRVRYMGPVDNVRDFYWLSDIFVLPSWFEGLSVALLESMACGMAVLVTKCAGNLEAVTDGVNGLTCKIDNEAHLAQQLQRLTDDADLRRTLGKEARQTVLAKYSMQAVSEAHLRVYAKVLDRSVAHEDRLGGGQ